MPTSERIEKAARAVMIEDGCGLTINGVRTLCDEASCGDAGELSCMCRNAAKVALSAAEGVKPRVKKLEWDGLRSGPYYIEIRAGGVADLYNNMDRDEDGEIDPMQGGYLTLISLDDLKALAQADYEARILSALQEGE